MTSKTEEMSGDPGVRADRVRRKRLWTLFLAVVAGGVAIDTLLLPTIGHGPNGGSQLPVAAAVAAGMVLLLLLYGGVGLHLRFADELERQDNLIGFAAGYLFNTGAFILWYLLHLGGLMGPPEAFPLFVSTALVGFLTYGFIKLRRAL